MRLVSVDIGNGWVKAKAGDAPERSTFFPSVGAIEQGAVHFDGLKSNNDLVIEFEGEKWAMGHTAYKVGRMQVMDMGRGRIEEAFYRRLYATALAQILDKDQNLAVIASLPVRWYMNELERAKDVLAGEIRVRYGGVMKTFCIEREHVHIVPEGFGSLCNGVLNYDGSVADAELARSIVGVVDIGTRTTDFLLFNKMELYPAKSDGQDKVGMATVWQLLGEDIVRDHGRELSELDLDNAIQDGFIRYGGERYDVSSGVKRAAQALGETVSSKIRSLWDNGRDADVILVTGGGAELAFDNLPFKNKRLIQDGYFANTEGAYRFGLLRGFNNG